jgi:(heptosyl)LPS beta-1,4-glucosyltransferase
MAPKITVLIPCKDERHNIRACIESARLVADEILVADSLSTDDTLEIVRQLGGCRIIQREFVDHADFKNWAIPQASHPWVLVVDADERVTGALAVEIRETLAHEDPSLDAYRMRRDNFFLGYPIRHCGWNSPTIVRLFRRDVCRYGAARVHERMEVAPERVGTLRGKLIHYTCTSLDHWIAKQNRYSTVITEDKRAAGNWTCGLGILGIPLVRFIHLYIFRGGFLDGTPGLIVSMTSASYTFLKHAKLWNLNHPCDPEAPSEKCAPHAPREEDASRAA